MGQTVRRALRSAQLGRSVGPRPSALQGGWTLGTLDRLRVPFAGNWSWWTVGVWPETLPSAAAAVSILGLPALCGLHGRNTPVGIFPKAVMRRARHLHPLLPASRRWTTRSPFPIPLCSAWNERSAWPCWATAASVATPGHGSVQNGRPGSSSKKRRKGPRPRPSGWKLSACSAKRSPGAIAPLGFLGRWLGGGRS